MAPIWSDKKTYEKCLKIAEEENRCPELHELLGCEPSQITWLPIKPSNPSKLICHYFKDGKWIETSYQRFASWPEKFG